jgi:hypothetical protein
MMLIRLLLVVLVLLWAGCSASRQLATPSHTLEEVNRKLGARYVRIHLVDGTNIRARNVRVSPTAVVYDAAYGNRADSLAMHSVQKITTNTHGGMLKGAGIGLMGAAVSSYFMIKAAQKVEGDGYAAGIGAALYAACSSIAGPFIGAVLGGSFFPSKTHVLYRAPVGRYPSKSSK